MTSRRKKVFTIDQRGESVLFCFFFRRRESRTTSLAGRPACVRVVKLRGASMAPSFFRTLPLSLSFASTLSLFLAPYILTHTLARSFYRSRAFTLSFSLVDSHRLPLILVLSHSLSHLLTCISVSFSSPRMSRCVVPFFSSLLLIISFFIRRSFLRAITSRSSVYAYLREASLVRD